MHLYEKFFFKREESSELLESDLIIPADSYMKGGTLEISEIIDLVLPFLEKLIQGLEEEGLKRATNTCERYIYDLYNYQAFPEKHWSRIKTTNMLERVNKELKRRSKVVRAFPNEKSLVRLAVTILIDINEEWLTKRRYLIMEDWTYNGMQGIFTPFS